MFALLCFVSAISLYTLYVDYIYISHEAATLSALSMTCVNNWSVGREGLHGE